MKRLLFILLFCTFLFSASSEPQFSSVGQHNNWLLNITTPNIQSIYLNAEGYPVATFDEPVQFGSGRLLTMFPSVDDRISANNETYVLWTWAKMQTDSIIEENPSDGCADKKELEGFTFTGSVDYDFRNITESIAINDNTALKLQTPIGGGVLNQTNGTNKLTVTLNGRIEFNYNWEIKECVGSPLCSCDIVEERLIKYNKTFSNQLEYIVEGGNVIFFLSKPALKEQWFKNNRFDNIVLSKRLFHKGNIELNDGTIAAFNFYDFDIDEDKYGVQHSISLQNRLVSGMNASEQNAIIVPTPLEKENETFVYVNTFNASYIALGVNNLTLMLSDHFGNIFESRVAIASRAISFAGNISEEKSSYNKNVRKSAMETSYALLFEPMAWATIGVLIMAIFVLNKLRKY